jgi:hypothetical protein
MASNIIEFFGYSPEDKSAAAGGRRVMTKDEVLAGLKAGRRLHCDRKDDPLLPWLLSHPNIANSGVVQVDDQSSYIAFWWQEEDNDE